MFFEVAGVVIPVVCAVICFVAVFTYLRRRRIQNTGSTVVYGDAGVAMQPVYAGQPAYGGQQPQVVYMQPGQQQQQAYQQGNVVCAFPSFYCIPFPAFGC